MQKKYLESNTNFTYDNHGQQDNKYDYEIETEKWHCNNLGHLTWIFLDQLPVSPIPMPKATTPSPNSWPEK